MSESEREVKRIHFTRSTDVKVVGKENEFGGKAPDAFEQEPTEHWADIILRPSGGEVRKYFTLVERVTGTAERYQIAVDAVKRFTVAWSLTDAGGARLPIDDKGFDDADADFMKQLAEAIYAIVGPRFPKL